MRSGIGLDDDLSIRRVLLQLLQPLPELLRVDDLSFDHGAPIGEDGNREVLRGEVQLLRRSLGQIDVDAGSRASLAGLHQGGARHHEDDEEHEEDVGQRGDVDLAEDRGRSVAKVVVVVMATVRTADRHQTLTPCAGAAAEGSAGVGRVAESEARSASAFSCTASTSSSALSVRSKASLLTRAWK